MSKESCYCPIYNAKGYHGDTACCIWCRYAKARATTKCRCGEPATYTNPLTGEKCCADCGDKTVTLHSRCAWAY